jgi:hypothetical protein
MDLFVDPRPRAAAGSLVASIRPSTRTLRLALAVLILAAALLAAAGRGASAAPADGACRTPFFVATDPNNAGQVRQVGQETIVRESGVVGQYQGGRLDGYTITGMQALKINHVTNEAQIRGTLTATSADGASSLTVSYSGHADLNTGMATGSFVADSGTGEFAGFRANGTIEATLVGPAAFQGFDVGLC